MLRRRNILLALPFLMTLAGACAPSFEQRELNAADAVKAFQAGDFDDAREEADKVLKEDSMNPFAAVVAGVTEYKRTMHDLVADAQTVAVGTVATGNFNQRYLDHTLSKASKGLEEADRYLRAAAMEPDIYMELCLACWTVDWNANGRHDEMDARLLEIEQDENEHPIDERDPRRRPTFRFDHGDLYWSLAFLSFQRAAIEMVRAYDWRELGQIFEGGLFGSRSSTPERIKFKLLSKERVHQARALMLQGMDYSDKARRAYLKETDDDREWLPNPVQEDHPLPLPVDRRLYDTWEKMLQDLRALVQGEEGLSVAEIAQLGDHKWDDPPEGYIDIGKMLSEPDDIVINLETLDDLDDYRDDDEARNVERALKKLFGDYYVKKKKPSPILHRLERMKMDMISGKESLERKLRYLLWVN